MSEYNPESALESSFAPMLRLCQGECDSEDIKKRTNVLDAINLTGADFVDINSGVEEKKGEKNLSLIDRLVSSLKLNEKL